jgi:hypothetical protein
LIPGGFKLNHPTIQASDRKCDPLLRERLVTVIADVPIVL